MKWILIALAVLAALIAAVVVIGLLIPKSHTARRRVEYGQAPEKVWEVISDFERHAKWRDGIRRVERLADRNGHAVWCEVRGRGDRLTMEVVEFDPPRRMVTKVVDNRNFGGTWTWQVEPTGGGCALTITEEGEIYNPVFRFAARFILGYHATMDGVHRALRARFGEPAVD